MTMIAQIISGVLVGAGILGTLTYGILVADVIADGRTPSLARAIPLIISLLLMVLAYNISRWVKQQKKSNATAK